MHMNVTMSTIAKMYSILPIHSNHMILHIFHSGEILLVFLIILLMSGSIFRISIFRPHVGKDHTTISTVINVIIVSIYLDVHDSETSRTASSIDNTPRKIGKVP